MEFTVFDNMRRNYRLNNGMIEIESTQDVEPNLMYAKNKRDNEDAYVRKKQDMVHYANIPNVIVEKWMKEDDFNLLTATDDDLPKLKRLIEIDYPYLKTTNLREI